MSELEELEEQLSDSIRCAACSHAASGAPLLAGPASNHYQHCWCCCCCRGCPQLTSLLVLLLLLQGCGWTTQGGG